MKIYTYFEQIYGEQEHIENLNLLELWERRWSNYGYTPVVLNRSHAVKHPKYSLYLEKFQSFPTINHQKYELSCFLRWVAMSNIGGCISDYDVFPNTNNSDYDCETLKKKLLHHNENKNNNLSIWSGTACPCLTSGSAIAYQKILDLFFEIDLEDYFSIQEEDPMMFHGFKDRGSLRNLWDRATNKRLLLRHVSDQQIIYYHWKLKALHRMEFHDFYEKDVMQLCEEPIKDGWEQMPVIHFSNRAVSGREKRYEVVERILGCQF